jgi:HD-like signal output (HDOD) protein
MMKKKQILFVDDDREIRSLIGAKLRPQMQEWYLQFADDGHQALAFLAEQTADVIVSDIEMPKMSGVELLNQVRERHPQVVRILLSGQTDQEVRFHSIESSHQYMRKPWGVAELKDTLERAFALQDRLNNEAIRTLVAKLPSLPTLSSSYFELMQEIQSEEPSLTQIGKTISQDLGMTAMLLKLVNSAYFGLRVTVSDPVHAARLLGLDTITALVLTHQVFSKFSDIDNKLLPMEQLMEHSLGVGSLAKMIAETETRSEDVVTDSIIGGVLHDTGKLILAQNFPSDYGRVLTEAEGNDRPLWAIEKDAFSVCHAEVGAYLLGIWGLPESIVEAVAFHHEPTTCGPPEVRAVTTVHAANAITQEKNSDLECPNVSKLDEHYLTQISATDRVEVWRDNWRQLTKNAPPEI